MATRPTLPNSQWIVTTAVQPAFPLGPRILWVSREGRTYAATLLNGANRYVIVTGVDPDDAHTYEDDLATLRRDLARAAGWNVTDADPKLGCVAVVPDALPRLRFRVRQGDTQGWHPAMAGSGVVSLAAASATPGTVVADLLGTPLDGDGTVIIPGGELRTFAVHRIDGTMKITYLLSPVTPLVRDGLDPALAA